MIPGAVGAAESAATEKLVAVTRLRDPALADHGMRTAHIAAAVASELGLTPEEADRVYLGALLHDIGKLGIPEAVLWKPTGLDTTEWREVRNHPEEGHRLVADIVAREVAACVLYHHERVDAEGYPFGVGLRTLPIAVRIVQVADAYDAMTSDRPYEGPLPVATALAELRRCAGTQFDAEVVAALGRLLAAGAADRAVVLPSAADPLPADPFAVSIGIAG
ncbi:MAG TPA: HD domain-containing phosphohydrolase [Acidimicrobiia bacterium]|nr:HD domain-containing phosphohydrolase [Acidimicrobiia bacterium]